MAAFGNVFFLGVCYVSSLLRFFTGSCTAVKCPAHSSGTDVPSGCACVAGHLGDCKQKTPLVLRGETWWKQREKWGGGNG